MIDAEARKRGERTGLDTLVVHAVNDDHSLSAIHSRRLSEALSDPPGEYDRKVETQRNWRGPAQAEEHVV